MGLRRWLVGLLIGLAAMLLVVVPALASGLFSDVPADHPYVTAIEDLANRGIIGGYGNGNFGPADLVKRQQFAKMIVLTVGITPTESDMCSFPDVEHKAGDLYPFHYVAVAASTGLTTGYKDGTFGPANPITRQQVITMAVRAGGADLETPPEGWAGAFSYTDATHGPNIRKAEYNGLLAGVQFSDATQNATRGECAQILYNLLIIKGGGAPSTTSTTAHVTTTTTRPSTTTTTAYGVALFRTASGTKYHRDGCRYLSSSKIPVTLAEAKAMGLEPCSVCNPPHW